MGKQLKAVMRLCRKLNALTLFSCHAFSRVKQINFPTNNIQYLQQAYSEYEFLNLVCLEISVMLVFTCCEQIMYHNCLQIQSDSIDFKQNDLAYYNNII